MDEDMLRQFKSLFRAARKEHLSGSDARQNHDKALAFARNHDLAWAETLLNASLLDCQKKTVEALEALHSVQRDIPAEAHGLYWILEGHFLSNQENYNEAISAYKKALDNPIYDSPGNAWLNIGIALFKQKNYDEAIFAYKKTLDDSMYDTPGNAWINIGTTLSMQGKYDKAFFAYKKALDDPKFDSPGKIWLKIGSALYEQEKYDEAVSAYKKALNDSAFDSPGDAWFNIGIAFGELKNYDEAISAFKKVLDDLKFDSPGDAWIRIGYTLYEQNKYDEAVSAYKKALDDPKFEFPGNAWLNIGFALGKQGKYNDAILAFKKALDDPKFEFPGNAWLNIGITFDKQEKYDEAISAYKKALDDPTYNSPGDAWFNMGLSLFNQKKFEEAIFAYNKALEDPAFNSIGKAWLHIGYILYVQNKSDEAISALKRALDDPAFDSPGKAWFGIGLTLEDQKKYNEAIYTYKKALNHDNKKINGDALLQLARVLRRKRRSAEAREYLREILDNQNDYSEDIVVEARKLFTLIESKLSKKALSPEDQAVLSGDRGSTISLQSAQIPGEVSKEDQWSNAETRLRTKIDSAALTAYDDYARKGNSGKDNVLSIMKGWSSSVTLLEGFAGQRRGGGYFLKWKGNGIVIDPGFDFLHNFQDHPYKYHCREIRAVIVSHSHIDHNRDLDKIDNLFYELYKTNTGATPDSEKLFPFIPFLDENTKNTVSFSVKRGAKHRVSTKTFDSGRCLSYNKNIGANTYDTFDSPESLPIRLDAFLVKHNNPHNAFGIRLHLKKDDDSFFTLGYTGDTGFFDALPKRLAGCDLVIAHISQPTNEELADFSKAQLKKEHLGYKGIVKLIEQCDAKAFLVSEFWAGFDDIRIDLIQAIREKTEKKAILPASIGMNIFLPDMSVECSQCGKPVKFNEVRVSPSSEKFGPLMYLCKECVL